MDYFNQGSRRRGNTINDEQNRARAPFAARPGYLESLRAPSSIRIRRLPSGNVAQFGHSAAQQQTQSSAPAGRNSDDAGSTGRRRSASAPQRYDMLAVPSNDLTRQRTEEPRRASHLPPIAEGQNNPLSPSALPEASATEEIEQLPHDSPPATPTPSGYDYGVGDPSLARPLTTGASVGQGAGNTSRRNRGIRRLKSNISTIRRGGDAEDEYDSEVVDLLDLVDPEVRTLGTLTNVQNSLFVPDLGRLINRRPTYDLSRRGTSQQSRFTVDSAARTGRSRAGTAAAKPDLSVPKEQPEQEEAAEQGIEMQPQLSRRLSITSNLSDSRYAVLPHGVSLEGWSEADKEELNDYVRHLMHSRREGFKRSMRGFKQYISKPLGLFVFVYAVLITLFGAAWVFFLIGFISVGSKQKYVINVVDNILVALFALVGDGLAPFRAVDTYHMCFIAHYYTTTWRVRKERNLPDLLDHNDLPERRASLGDLEEQKDSKETVEFSVLKPLQQKRLEYHQAKFSKAHTFYKPHETATHHAFPLRLLVAIVVLLDCHSLFQIALGTVTWSINYQVRPEAATAAILCCSITSNIVAGILISIGDHRTRKKDVLERIKRQNLTEEALRHIQKSRPSHDHVVRNSIAPQLEAIVRDENEAPMVPEEQQLGMHMAGSKKSI